MLKSKSNEYFECRSRTSRRSNVAAREASVYPSNPKLPTRPKRSAKDRRAPCPLCRPPRRECGACRRIPTGCERPDAPNPTTGNGSSRDCRPKRRRGRHRWRFARDANAAPSARRRRRRRMFVLTGENHLGVSSEGIARDGNEHAGHRCCMSSTESALCGQ